MDSSGLQSTFYLGKWAPDIDRMGLQGKQDQREFERKRSPAIVAVGGSKEGRKDTRKWWRWCLLYTLSEESLKRK